MAIYLNLNELSALMLPIVIEKSWNSAHMTETS